MKRDGYTFVCNPYSAIWVLSLKEVFDLNTVAEIPKGWIILWSLITFVIMYVAIMYVAIMIRIINSHAIGHKVITSGTWYFFFLPIRYLFRFFMSTCSSQLSAISSNTHTGQVLLLQKDLVYIGCAGVIFIQLGWKALFLEVREFLLLQNRRWI